MFPIKEMNATCLCLSPALFLNCCYCFSSPFLLSLQVEFWEVLLTNTHTPWTRELVRVWAHYYHLYSQLLTSPKEVQAVDDLLCVLPTKVFCHSCWEHTKRKFIFTIRCSFSLTLPSCTGTDPQIEERGHTYTVGICVARIVRSWKFWNLGCVRVLLRPLETIITMQN